MAQLSKGTTYVTGDDVTAANLDALVDSATILPGAVSEQSAGSPVIGDKVLMANAAGDTLMAPTLTTIFGLQVADAAAGTASVRTLGYSGNKAAPGSTTPSKTASNAFTNNNQFVHIGGSYTGSLAIAAGAGLGTGGSPSATFDTNSTDLYGRITLVSGSSGGTGVTATVTFDSTFTNAPFVILIGYNANAVGLQANTSRISVSAVSTSQFAFSNAVALQASTTYIFSYIVLGL